MNPLTLCVNLFGGPGTGKSTTAAGVFYQLKQDGVNCELVTEYAKSKVWEESYKTLENQLYILGKQVHRQFILKDKVDVIITDAPIALSLYYGKDMGAAFEEVVDNAFGEYDNMNYLIERDDTIKYNPNGRTQTECESWDVHNSIRDMLNHWNFEFTLIRRGKYNHDSNVDMIVRDVHVELGIN